MSTVKEYEARTFITEEKYFELASEFIKKYKFFPILSIHNVYFETDNLDLRSKGIMLRLRRTYGKGCEFTLKIKGDAGDTEVTDNLTKHQEHILLKKNHFPDGDVKRYLVSNGLNPLNIKIIAELYTKRMEVNIDDYQYVLDKNTYGETVDYDLEVESKISLEHAEKVIKEFCEAHSISITANYKSKSRRAINSALENKNPAN